MTEPGNPTDIPPPGRPGPSLSLFDAVNISLGSIIDAEFD
jgi:hypothetical protein